MKLPTFVISNHARVNAQDAENHAAVALGTFAGQDAYAEQLLGEVCPCRVGGREEGREGGREGRCHVTTYGRCGSRIFYCHILLCILRARK